MRRLPSVYRKEPPLSAPFRISGRIIGRRDDLIQPALWMWSSFFALVIAILSFDLGILHNQNQEIGVAESVRLSALYIALG